VRLRSLLFWPTLLVLLGIGGLLTAARLLRPDGTLGVGLVALTPLALAAYALVVLLVVVPALRRRALAVLVLVLALAGAGLHAWWLAPLYSGATPPPSSTAETVTVMTLDVHGGDVDGPGVVAAVSEAGVDLLVLTEATPDLLAEMDAAGLSALFPDRVGAPDEADPETVLLSRTPITATTPLGEDAGSLSADLTLGGQEVRVLAVHPSWPVDDLAAWRDDQALVLAEAERGVDLVLGDLNATADHGAIRALAEAGLRDVAEVANQGWQPTWPSRPFPLVAIDHVLVGPRLAGLASRTLAVGGSDHRAVIAEVAAK
jgi:endonuclease/exonuclease/phosphatase (EEP) superfamily protein YafD